MYFESLFKCLDWINVIVGGKLESSCDVAHNFIKAVALSVQNELKLKENAKIYFNNTPRYLLFDKVFGIPRYLTYFVYMN